MSSQSFAAEQLLELLLQLKKTTPTAARQILNGQPQIAYALMTLMVSMNAVNFDVFQKTLAEYGNANKPAAPPSAPSSAHPSSSSTPVPALPPHMQPAPQSQYRTNTPPSVPAPGPPAGYGYQGPNGHGTPPPHAQQGYGAGYGQPSAGYGYNQPQAPAGYPGYPSHYSAPPPAAAPTPAIPDALAAIPDDQKALIMRVLSMTPEQIHMLPPNERSTFIQLRATLGAPIS